MTYLCIHRVINLQMWLVNSNLKNTVTNSSYSQWKTTSWRKGSTYTRKLRQKVYNLLWWKFSSVKTCKAVYEKENCWRQTGAVCRLLLRLLNIFCVSLLVEEMIARMTQETKVHWLPTVHIQQSSLINQTNFQIRTQDCANFKVHVGWTYFFS